jgi:uncharacterized integral membrane protein
LSFQEAQILGFFGRILGAVLTLIFIVISALLAISNPETVILSIWPFGIKLSTPLWLVISASFCLGLLIGAAAMLPPLLKGRFAIKQMSKLVSKFDSSKLDKSDKKPALPAK